MFLRAVQAQGERDVAQYAIMRCKKLATMGSVSAAMQHCYRERETLNADIRRTPDNEHHAAASTDEAMGRLRAMLPEKRRKDAVLAVEYMMSASPEWWAQATPAQQEQWRRQSMQWLSDKYGADRIVTATMHKDETTPHLSAFVVPLTADGRLSAKEFIGSKGKMSADQTSYAARVADLGLVRGIEGSKATHQRIQAHYAALGQDLTPLKIQPEALRPKTLSKRLFIKNEESPQMVAERLMSQLRVEVAPAFENAATALQERRRATEMRRTAQALQVKAKERDALLDGLTPEQKRLVQAQAEQLRAENALRKQQRSQIRNSLVERLEGDSVAPKLPRSRRRGR